MIAALAVIAVFGVIPKVLFPCIFRSEVYLTIYAEVVCITAFQMFGPFLVGREIEATFDTKVVTRASLHMQQSPLVGGKPFIAFAAKVM